VAAFAISVILTVFLLVDPAMAGVTTFSGWGPAVPAGGFYPECAKGYGKSAPNASPLSHETAAYYAPSGSCTTPLARPANWIGTRVIRYKMSAANSGNVLAICGTWSSIFYNQTGQSSVDPGWGGGCGAGLYALGGNHCYGFDNGVNCSRWWDGNTGWLTAFPNQNFSS
jgi:hypothetical protein